MRALVAARYLMSTSRLWELADVDMLDVSTRYRERDLVLRLTGGRACMAANATRMINDLGPFYVGSLLGHRSFRTQACCLTFAGAFSLRIVTLAWFWCGKLYHAKRFREYE